MTVAKAFEKGYIIALMRNLFTKFSMSHFSPLFSNAGGNVFTFQYITRVFQLAIRDLGYTGHYAGYSFYRRAVAREMGLTDAEIQLLGRWKSESYLLYIETSPAVLLNALRRCSNSISL